MLKTNKYSEEEKNNEQKEWQSKIKKRGKDEKKKEVKKKWNKKEKGRRNENVKETKTSTPSTTGADLWSDTVAEAGAVQPLKELWGGAFWQQAVDGTAAHVIWWGEIENMK